MARSSAFANNKVYTVYCSANTETESLCTQRFCCSAEFPAADNKIHLETSEISVLFLFLFILCSVWPETLFRRTQTNQFYTAVSFFFYYLFSSAPQRAAHADRPP